MKKLVCFLLSALLTSPAIRAKSLVFPQIANGADIRLEILLANPTDRVETSILHFLDAFGHPLLLDVNGVVSSTFVIELPPRGSYKGATSGSGQLEIGHALVEVGDNSMVSGAVIYKVGDCQVSVPSSSASFEQTIVIEQSEDVSSGLALSNPSDDEATIILRVTDANGTGIASTQVRLGPRGNIARFIRELIPALPKDFAGTIIGLSDKVFAAIGLRQSSSGALAVLPTSQSSPQTLALGAALTGDPNAGAIAVHSRGEKLYAITQGTGQRIEAITGAIWTNAKGSKLTVFLDDQHRPERAFLNDHILLFANYTKDSADIAVISPDGDIRVRRTVPLQTRERIRRLDAKIVDGLSLSDALEAAALAITTVGCAGAIIGTTGAAAPCAALVVAAVAASLEDDPLLEEASQAFEAIQCGARNIEACISSILSLGSDILDSIQTDLPGRTEELAVAEERLSHALFGNILAGDLSCVSIWNEDGDRVVECFTSGASVSHFAIGQEGDIFGTTNNILVLFSGITGSKKEVIFDGTLPGNERVGGLGYINFGPNGDLFVGAGPPDMILRFPKPNFAQPEIFAPLNAAPGDFDFGPNGDLFVVTARAEVLRIDGETGQSKGVFANGGRLSVPSTLEFAEDGLLYVSSRASADDDCSSIGKIVVYDGSTGAFVTQFQFIEDEDGQKRGIGIPRHIETGPQGLIWATTFHGGSACGTTFGSVAFDPITRRGRRTFGAADIRFLP